jgi:WD40 repeat protein
LLRGHDGAVRGLAFNADGSLLASAGVDGTVRVWRMRDGAPVATLRGHQGPANAVDFAADGRLMSTGDDGTVRVWDVATAREMVALSVYAGPGTNIEVSPDGRAVLTSSEEGRLVRQTFCQVCGPVETVLDLARSRGVRQLTPEEEQRYLS